MFKLAPEAGAAEALAFVMGGPFGVVTAMYVFRRLHEQRRRSDEARACTADKA